MTHEGRYDNIKALLNVSPPRAVRLDLPLDDNVEQSALRSTCSGSLASAIDLLESKINPLESKIKAGRLLPAAAFAGGDSDLSKLKALQQVAVMIKTQDQSTTNMFARCYFLSFAGCYVTSLATSGSRGVGGYGSAGRG